MNRFTRAAVAAIIAMPLAVPAVYAQDASSDTGSDTAAPATGSATGAPDQGTAGSGAESGAETTGDTGSGTATGADTGTGTDTDGEDSDGASGGADSPDPSGDAASADDPDVITDMSTVVVSVGETDITAGEVRDMLAAMGPQAQGQPMEILVPLAVEELVMRELVVQTAREEGLDEAPEVQEMSNGAGSEEAQENAVIRAYINRELEGVVTDEAVEAAYEEIEAGTEEEVPPLDEVRPQIEQQLQQRKLMEIRDDLKSRIDVVYYGPDGEPRDVGAGSAGSDEGTAGEDAGDGSAGEDDAAEDSSGTGGN